MQPEPQQLTLLNQLRATLSKDDKNLYECAQGLAKGTEKFIDQIHASRKTLESSKDKTISNMIKGYYYFIKESSWKDHHNKLDAIVWKVFEGKFVLKDIMTNEISVESDFKNFCSKVEGNMIKNKKQFAAQISAFCDKKQKTPQKGFEVIVKWIQKQHFIGQRSPTTLEKQIMIKLKIRCEANNFSKDTIEQAVSLTSILIWKKSQIELINIWTRIINNYITHQSGYHEDQILNIPAQYIDSRGNKQFPMADRPRIEFRGKIPYFQAILGKRFGINLHKFYDKGNRDWLACDGRQGQWAVAFYSQNIQGIVQPQTPESPETRMSKGRMAQLRSRSNMRKSTSSNLSTSFLHSFISSLQEKPKLPISEHLRYENTWCLNRPEEKVGRGIYCTPLFTHCLLHETKQIPIGGQFYRIILECRVRPEAIKCVQDDIHWLVNNPEDIRPYGLIIFTHAQLESIRALSKKQQFYGIPHGHESWHDEYLLWKEFKQNSKDKEIYLPKTRIVKSLPKLIQEKEMSRNIRVLQLNGLHEKQKLREEGMRELSNLPFPEVKKINLENQDIGDEGARLLGLNLSMKKLETIRLNNNHMSEIGAAHLINNQWPTGVKYKLDTVQCSRYKGFEYHIGETIQVAKYISDRSIKLLNFDRIDEIEDKSDKKLYRTLESLMKIPIRGSYEAINQESAQEQEKLIQQSKQQPVSVSTAILQLKNILGKQSEIIFSKNSTLLSQLTITLAMCGVDFKRVKVRHRIRDAPFEISSFENNNAALLQFVEWYRKKLMTQYYKSQQNQIWTDQIVQEDIIVHKIASGSIIVHASFDQNNPILPALVSRKCTCTGNPQPNCPHHDITIIPFFQCFNLSKSDFDSAGDFQFPNSQTTSRQWRGGIIYNQPVFSKRFGIRVTQMYDNRSDNWLKMNGNAQQWAVAFHGIRNPGTKIQGNRTILESIMLGMDTSNGKERLKAGAGQAHVMGKAINSNKDVGRGIYCSPEFTTCLRQYTQECSLTQDRFRVVLQCRIRPEALKITYREDYWVINESKDIRPYGIVLFTPEQYRKIEQIKNNPGFYATDCKWSTWKDRFLGFRAMHNLPNPW